MSAIRYRYRSNAGYGGYAGKARQNRDRSRAERFDMELMLEEYAEPECEQERVIPIRRRSEFLPSAGVVGSEVGYEFADRQMDLPLSPQRTGSADDSGCGDDVLAQLQIVGESVFDENSAPPSVAGSTEQEPRAVVTAARSSVAAPDSRRRLNLLAMDQSVFRGVPGAGLIYGCMIGGAAAAMLLLVLRFAIL